MRKALSALLCIAILFNFALANNGMTRPKGGSLLKQYHEEKQKEQEVNGTGNQELNELYCALYEKVAESDRVADHMGREEEIYDEFYGGSFIEEDMLIVCVTDFDNEYLDSEKIEYRLVDKSYNELLNEQSILEDKYEELYRLYGDEDSDEGWLINSISGIGINEAANIVVISLKDISAQKLFYEMFGDDFEVAFEEGEIYQETAFAYNPGMALYYITERNGVNITYGSVSIGYRAYRVLDSGSYEYGFATCGHGIIGSVGNDIYVNKSFTTIIGQLQLSRISGSTGVDVSFVRLGVGNSISSQVRYSDSGGSTSNCDTIASNIYMTSVAKGTTVYKVGATTYKTSGKVVNTNYTVTVSGTVFKNLTSTTLSADAGDSGGLVYMYYDGKYVPVGLIKSKNDSYTSYCKASVIADNTKIYPY